LVVSAAAQDAERDERHEATSHGCEKLTPYCGRGYS
jgi:hypothetical protein